LIGLTGTGTAAAAGGAKVGGAAGASEAGAAAGATGGSAGAGGASCATANAATLKAGISKRGSAGAGKSSGAGCRFGGFTALGVSANNIIVTSTGGASSDTCRTQSDCSKTQPPSKWAAKIAPANQRRDGGTSSSADAADGRHPCSAADRADENEGAAEKVTVDIATCALWRKCKYCANVNTNANDSHLII
jgi:hypothetical protein